MSLEVDSLRVHLELYTEELHALCALQTLTGWMLRPHAKRMDINFSSRGMEQSFDDGVHVTLAEVVEVGGWRTTGRASHQTDDHTSYRLVHAEFSLRSCPDHEVNS